MAISGQRPRIALISVHGDPAIEIGKEEAGGQNVYVRNVGEALSRQGWQVDMFTRRSDADQPEIVQHTPHCRTIRLTAGPQKFIPRDELFGYLPEFVEALQQFQADSGFQYDLVHTNYWLSSWVGMTLKKLQGVKQIHTYHSLGAVKYQSISAIPMIAKTRLATEKLCLETAERIVATSPQEKDHMRSLVSTHGSIDIIPCGTDTRRFGHISRIEARRALGLEQDAKIVLYVGRFDRRKGIETLVRAVGQSKLKDQNLKLIIGGGSRPGQSDGAERERIEGIVNELGLQDITMFPGRLGVENLHLYYAAADVSVVPSHYEPFGLVAIEAMASGTPVVASDVGGLQFTVIPEITGLLAPAKDDAAFAKAIDRILADPNWRDQLGQAGRDRVEKMFSWDGVAAQLGKVYQQVLKVPTKAPAAAIA
ncbi:MAG: glycosyltransferase family 1 protein [Leptolyngbya sp. UWPOB_LEPTO1]|uniref:glycosyltransferase family 4 protein n=1 Tax=Leptolyngbya sp. UWPOB_LEPTO1 TaxID=2815653 RepID=UPI001ACB76C5|nr:glycosyltransferase family 1 protein [Leptolyngbya sp. UWPOB_LEPTO1]MBN8563685.1 glycosyltransferase family 1 protein [Leptolyngbya sp. UWPOB_LEPTO1]